MSILQNYMVSSHTSIVPTTYSESKAMMIVIPTSQLNALQNPINAFSSSSSSCSLHETSQYILFSGQTIYITVLIFLAQCPKRKALKMIIIAVSLIAQLHSMMLNTKRLLKILITTTVIDTAFFFFFFSFLQK